MLTGFLSSSQLLSTFTNLLLFNSTVNTFLHYFSKYFQLPNSPNFQLYTTMMVYSPFFRLSFPLSLYAYSLKSPHCNLLYFLLQSAIFLLLQFAMWKTCEFPSILLILKYRGIPLKKRQQHPPYILVSPTSTPTLKALQTQKKGYSLNP